MFKIGDRVEIIGKCEDSTSTDKINYIGIKGVIIKNVGGTFPYDLKLDEGSNFYLWNDNELKLEGDDVKIYNTSEMINEIIQNPTKQFIEDNETQDSRVGFINKRLVWMGKSQSNQEFVVSTNELVWVEYKQPKTFQELLEIISTKKPTTQFKVEQNKFNQLFGHEGIYYMDDFLEFIHDKLCMRYIANVMLEGKFYIID